MSTDRRIFHITHVDNLSGIVATGGLQSNAAQGGAAQQVIGMNTIKQRHMRLPVSVHPTTFVGQYVPFYFCPRSIMLYVIHKANNPDLEYRGGQDPIIHLSALLANVLHWLQTNRTT